MITNFILVFLISFIIYLKIYFYQIEVIKEDYKNYDL